MDTILAVIHIFIQGTECLASLDRHWDSIFSLFPALPPMDPQGHWDKWVNFEAANYETGNIFGQYIYQQLCIHPSFELLGISIITCVKIHLIVDFKTNCQASS